MDQLDTAYACRSALSRVKGIKALAAPEKKDVGERIYTS